MWPFQKECILGILLNNRIIAPGQSLATQAFNFTIKNFNFEWIAAVYSIFETHIVHQSTQDPLHANHFDQWKTVLEFSGFAWVCWNSTELATVFIERYSWKPNFFSVLMTIGVSSLLLKSLSHKMSWYYQLEKEAPELPDDIKIKLAWYRPGEGMLRAILLFRALASASLAYLAPSHRIPYVICALSQAYNFLLFSKLKWLKVTRPFKPTHESSNNYTASLTYTLLMPQIAHTHHICCVCSKADSNTALSEEYALHDKCLIKQLDQEEKGKAVYTIKEEKASPFTELSASFTVENVALSLTPVNCCMQAHFQHKTIQQFFYTMRLTPPSSISTFLTLPLFDRWSLVHTLCTTALSLTKYNSPEKAGVPVMTQRFFQIGSLILSVRNYSLLFNTCLTSLKKMHRTYPRATKMGCLFVIALAYVGAKRISFDTTSLPICRLISDIALVPLSSHAHLKLSNIALQIFTLYEPIPLF